MPLSLVQRPCAGTKPTAVTSPPEISQGPITSLGGCNKKPKGCWRVPSPPLRTKLHFSQRVSSQFNSDPLGAPASLSCPIFQEQRNCLVNHILKINGLYTIKFVIIVQSVQKNNYAFSGTSKARYLFFYIENKMGTLTYLTISGCKLKNGT